MRSRGWKTTEFLCLLALGSLFALGAIQDPVFALVAAPSAAWCYGKYCENRGATKTGAPLK